MLEIAMKEYCLPIELRKLGSEALLWCNTKKEFAFPFLKEQLFILWEI
jgi:hypothetical protein